MTVDKINLNKKIALKLFNAKTAVETKIHELTYLFWECTLRCNLSCIHCGSDCSKDEVSVDMPKEDFLNVLDSLEPHIDKNKFIIAISGGEPLLRQDLLEACYEIKKRGFDWGIVTNGFLLTIEKMKELRRAGLKSIAISFDGLKDEHNWFRGNEKSFDKALNAISYAVDELKSGLIFDVVTCVNQRNFSQLSDIRDLLIDKGVRKWRLGTIFPKGRAKDNTELKITGEQLKKLLAFIESTREEGKIIPSYGCESFLGNYELRVRNVPFFCRAGVNVGSVLVDGSISACPSLRADYIQGNIYRDNFWDIWNNKFDIMRNRDWTKTGKCESCKVWKYCKGNSLHLRDEKNGELLYCSYDEMVQS